MVDQLLLFMTDFLQSICLTYWPDDPPFRPKIFSCHCFQIEVVIMDESREAMQWISPKEWGPESLFLFFATIMLASAPLARLSLGYLLLS
jgi:hypothetical protein